MAYCAYKFKYVLVGDIGVGKSCFLRQFISDQFNPRHDLTVGMEFGGKTIVIDGKPIKLHLWDTAGQEAYRCITRMCFRHAVCALLVYDITRRETFKNLKGWLDEARQSSDPNIMVMLIGNKSDLEEKRQVKRREGEQFANEHGLLFMEASAKDKINVDEAYARTAQAIYDRITNGLMSLELSGQSRAVKIGSTQGDGGGNRFSKFMSRCCHR